MLRLRGYRYKFTHEQEKQIVADYQAGIRVREIIKKYGMTLNTLYAVLRREETWQEEE